MAHWLLKTCKLKILWKKSIWKFLTFPKYVCRRGSYNFWNQFWLWGCSRGPLKIFKNIAFLHLFWHFQTLFGTYNSSFISSKLLLIPRNLWKTLWSSQNLFSKSRFCYLRNHGNYLKFHIFCKGGPQGSRAFQTLNIISRNVKKIFWIGFSTENLWF